ncbi:hypothetical protein, partial [Xanthomonas nasturtii]|uniref:hypothetical protein n=1 Tax=Xanthomonas nasturtii TaxID=1843581 RepID=UPI0011C03B46
MPELLLRTCRASASGVHALVVLEPVHDLRRSVQTMRMRQKTYPSDMSREQFAHVLPILEQ